MNHTKQAKLHAELALEALKMGETPRVLDIAKHHLLDAIKSIEVEMGSGVVKFELWTDETKIKFIDAPAKLTLKEAVRKAAMELACDSAHIPVIAQIIAKHLGQVEVTESVTLSAKELV